MPLVDVMLVLLIIFMVTAPMMQQGLSEPAAGAAGGPDERAAGHGHGARRLPEDARVVQLGTENVRLDVLQERMRQAILGRDDKSVFIRADAGATCRTCSTSPTS